MKLLYHETSISGEIKRRFALSECPLVSHVNKHKMFQYFVSDYENYARPQI
jgi:hypothetical protein